MVVECNPHAVFFGFMGIAAAVIFANLGSAYGTAKAGVGICSMGVMRPDLVTKSIVPVIMAGILAIYGLVFGIISIRRITSDPTSYSYFVAYLQLAGGLIVGLSNLAAGLCIGIVGDAAVRANAQQPRLFIGLILILIFGEVLGIYGLIMGILLDNQIKTGSCKAYAVA